MVLAAAANAHLLVTAADKPEPPLAAKEVVCQGRNILLVRRGCIGPVWNSPDDAASMNVLCAAGLAAAAAGAAGGSRSSSSSSSSSAAAASLTIWQPPWKQDRFAIGFWVDPMVPPDRFDEEYARIAAANFTILLGGYGATKPPEVKLQIAAARRAGLAAIPSFCNGACANLSGPGVWGFQIIDEPQVPMFPAVAQLVAQAKAAGDMAFVNLFPDYAFGPHSPFGTSYSAYVRRYVQEVQPNMLSLDNYPHFDTAGGSGCAAPPCAAGPQTKANYIANLLVLREAALAAGIPFWNFFKAMPYGAGTSPSPYDVSESEMRWQAMTSLALGAKGVMYYCYWTPNGVASRLGQAIMTPAPGSKPNLANQVPGPKYPMVRRINSKLRTLGEWLLERTSSGVVRASGGRANTTAIIEGCAGMITAINGTNVGDRWSFLLGMYDDNRTVLLVNQDSNHPALATLALARREHGAEMMREVDPHSGELRPALDDAPFAPGFQLSVGPGDARLLTWARGGDVLMRSPPAMKSDDTTVFLRSAAESTPAMQVAAVKAMTSRLLGAESVPKFEFVILDLASGDAGRQTCFELAPATAVGGVAVIRGSTGVELAAGLGHYLRHVANMSFSWPGTGGSSFNGTAAELPALASTSPQAKRFYRSAKWLNTWNVCTFSYSFVWWSFDRWQHEIDLMALFGVNLPLAYVGQEAVVRALYKKSPYNLSDADLAAFFSGPAWLTWQRSQGLRGWGGPLPLGWIDDHQVLQRKILTAMRVIGMTPVLPAFGGWVPTALQKLYPYANISRVGKPPLCVRGTLGDEFGCPAMVDAVDPLFQQLGRDWMSELNAIYSTGDHMFGADGFFSTIHAPWATLGTSEQSKVGTELSDADADNLRLLRNQPPEWWAAHARGVYQSMVSSDRQAVWVYQSYPWHQFIYYHKAVPGGGDPIALTRSLSKAWVSAVPKGKLLLLDLWADAGPLWHLLDSFFGHDWIWCMLHSFGGNDGLWGDLRTVSREPVLALWNSTPGSLQGFSVTPEGINQNWIAYELMLETPWRERPLSAPELSSWVEGYAERRGHGVSPGAQVHVTSAWHHLASCVYNLSCAAPGDTPHDSEECPAQREPGLGFHALNRQPVLRYSEKSLFYKIKPLVAAWHHLLQATAASDGKSPGTLLHDLVDISREALAAVSDIFANRIHNGLTGAFQQMNELITDMDNLLATDQGFLLGPWVKNATSWGHNTRERALYSFNAKYQITGWSFHYYGKAMPALPLWPSPLSHLPNSLLISRQESCQGLATTQPRCGVGCLLATTVNGGHYSGILLNVYRRTQGWRLLAPLAISI
jgi:alpha-N-acetylglucosaminidase